LFAFSFLRFPSFSPVNPAFFSLSKLFKTFSLTLSTFHPSLAAVNKTLRQKTLSAVAMAAIYAVLGFAFYWFFLVSQF
jgi:hypothetical protein